MDTHCDEGDTRCESNVSDDSDVHCDETNTELLDNSCRKKEIPSFRMMEEKTSLLSKDGSSYSHQSYDENHQSHLYAGSRPGSVTDSNINVTFHDRSSDYHDYDIRVDSALSDRNEEAKHVTRVYKRRWYILFILSLCVTLQNAVWAVWGPIAESAKFVYGWNTTMIFIITNCGNVGVLLPVLFTGHLVSKKGLRVSVILCTFLLAFGSGLRVIPRYDTIGTVLVGTGQFFNGLAGSITQIIPAVLSETWFPTNERATATAIGVISNSVGGIVAFMLGPNIVHEPNSSATAPNNTEHDLTEKHRVQHQIWTLALIECGVGAALFIITLIYFPAKPPTPPSISAQEDRVTFSQGICSIVKKPLVLIAAMSCAVPWAVYGNWMGLISVNFHDIGISQSQAGWYGFYASIAGVFTGILVGRIADRFQRHLKLFVIIFFIVALVDIVWITCMRNGYLPRSTVMLGVSIGILGATFNACLPLCYEMACESGYPVHEGIVGTFISLEINTTAVIFLLVKLIPNIGVIWMNWVLVGVVAFGIVCLLCIKERYHRTEVDANINVRAGKQK